MVNDSGGGGGGAVDTSPTTFLDRAKGADLTTLAKRGFGGWLLAVATAIITSTQQVLDLLVVTPINVMTDVIDQSAEAFFLSPLDVIDSGADASATGAGEFGIFGLLVGLAVVLAGYRMVTWYLSDEDTGDLVPTGGLDVVPFVGGAEEDEDEG